MNLAPLALDYQRLPPGRQAPGIGLLALGLLLVGGLLAWSAQLAERIDRADAAVARLRQAAEHRRLFEAARQAQQAVPAAPLSPTARRWDSLFTALESAAGDNVTLLSLAPGPRLLTLTGEAAGIDAAFDYTGRLQGVPALASARLAQYEVMREQPRQPVRFTIQADWTPVPP